MTEIKDLTDIATRFRDERDWKQFHSPKDMILSLMIETSELAEIFQFKTNEQIDAIISRHSKELGEELADVLYWVLVLANDLNVDLAQAFKQKMKVNEEKYPVSKARGQNTKYTEL